MFSSVYNLPKTTSNFFPVEISSNNVRGINVDFWTIEITSKKVRGNDADFSISEITSKKVRGNDVDFSINELHQNNTWKWRENWPKFGWRRIDVISMTNRCPFDVSARLEA